MSRPGQESGLGSPSYKRLRVELLRSFDLSYDYLRRLLEGLSPHEDCPQNRGLSSGGKKCSVTSSYSRS
jgi:hypothetical protein